MKYFVGDIHGCYDKLMEKLDEIQFDFDEDILISVGDLIDRGPHSLKCLELVYKPWFYAVRGNHEEMAREAVEDLSDLHIRRHWYMNGGDWFEILYRGRVLDAISKMPYTMTVKTEKGETIGIVHADMGRTWKYIGEMGHPAYVWGRSDIRSSEPVLVAGVDAVVSGHTVTEGVVVKDNRVWIDTGCVFTGQLTILSEVEIMELVNEKAASNITTATDSDSGL